MTNKYQVNYQEIFSAVIAGKDVKTTASDVIEIPANTVITGIVYEEVEKCDASETITLKAKTAHSASGSFNGFTTGSSDPVSGFVPAVTNTVNATVTSGASGETVTVAVPGAFFTKKGDVLTIAAASNLTKGKIRIGLVGFRTGMTADITSAGDNKAPADVYTPPEKK